MSKFMMLSFNNFIIWYWLASLDRTFADGIATGGRLAKIAVVHELSGGFPTDVIEHVFETRIPSLNLEILSLYINGTRDLDDSELFDAGRLLRGRNDVLAVVGPSNSNDVTLFHPHAVLMDIPHIVPMATDPIFDGMDRFPMLIRMTPGYNYQIDAFLDLVTQLNWTSLAIISSESDYAHHAGERFRQSAEGRGVKVISPSKNLYPDWSKSIRSTFGDSLERVKWRSKQNLDQVFLMMHIYHLRAKYYLMMEDDVIASKEYMKKLLLTVKMKENTRTPWIYISFCGLGAIGKLFRRRTLPSYASFIHTFWNAKPLDWLQIDFARSRMCSYDEPEKTCWKRLKSVLPETHPSLFQHVGKYSSLPGKIQKLRDTRFKN